MSMMRWTSVAAALIAALGTPARVAADSPFGPCSHDWIVEHILTSAEWHSVPMEGDLSFSRIQAVATARNLDFPNAPLRKHFVFAGSTASGAVLDCGGDYVRSIGDP